MTSIKKFLKFSLYSPIFYIAILLSSCNKDGLLEESWVIDKANHTLINDGLIQLGTSEKSLIDMMKAGKYKASGLAMVPDPSSRLLFWSVENGILIVTLSKKTNKVTAMTYFLCDERPRSIRTEFNLPLSQFNTKTGEMVLKAKNIKNKQKQALISRHGIIRKVTGHYVSGKEKSRTYWSDNMATNLAYITSVNGLECKVQTQLRGKVLPKKDGEFTLYGYFEHQVAPFGLVEGLDNKEMQGHSFGYELLFVIIDAKNIEAKHLKEIESL